MALDDVHTFTLTVGGNDVTKYLIRASLQVTDALTSEVDTCTFTLEDTDGACSVSEWDEVVLTDETSTRVFAGYTTYVRRRAVRGAVEQIECRCQDYSVLLKGVQVNAAYTDMTDAAIIADMFASLVSGDGFDVTTYVSASGTLDHIRFNRTNLLEAMRQLADRTGYDWYVDYDKCLHYFDPTSGAADAPFDLADAGQADYVSKFPMSGEGLELEVDGQDIRNRVYVYGGMYEAPPFTQRWTADGVMQEFWLAYQPVTIYSITVDGVAQTFGVDFVDNPNSYDCLVNYQEKVIRFYQSAPASGAEVACVYSYKVPIAVRVQDNDSYTLYGRWFDYTVVDPKIRTIEEAKEVGRAILADYATAQVTARARVERMGLRSGMRVQVWDAVLGINGTEYLIQRVVRRLGRHDQFIHELTLGAYDGGLVALLLDLKRTRRDLLEERAAETLRLVMTMGPETLEVGETFALSLDPMGDYVWGEAPGQQEGYWDAATWG